MVTSMDNAKNAPIAKWGAAYSLCALAKVKCMRSSEVLGPRCDRCKRLDKDCVNQVHKPRKKRQNRPSKTAQLEERLNSLVDFIKATNSKDIPISLERVPGSGQNTSCPKKPEREVRLQSQEAHNDTATQTSGPDREPSHGIPSSYNDNAPRICVCRAEAGEAPVQLESDDALLSTFVHKLMPNYPFVVFPSSMTSPELISKSPFLFATIRMVASYRNLRSMRSQNYFIMRHISEQMLMRSERSLELLQSILLILGYYHYHCLLHAQMNNLIALACSLVADLGINKPPDYQERTKLLTTNTEPPRARTDDERRALCGVWYITSIGSLAFKRIDPPKYTSYIDQCLMELDANDEYETDSLLVHLVRIQHLSERISRIHNRENAEDSLVGITPAPISAYSGIFHSELERFRASLPQNIRSNGLLICHLNTANLRLWEPLKTDAALLEKISNSLTSLSLDSASSSLDILYQSSSALRTWFDSWLSINVTDYFILPMPVSAQLVNAVTMLARWAKLFGVGASYTPSLASATATTVTKTARDDLVFNPTLSTIPVLITKDIDPAIPAKIYAIRSHVLSRRELQIDVPSILQAMAAKFEQARGASAKQDSVWENDIWELAARKIKATSSKLERWAEMAASASGENLLGHKPQPIGGNIPGEPGLSAPSIERNWPRESLADAELSIQPTWEGWYPDVLWENNLFEGLGLDQNFFFDSPGDYGTIVLNSFELPGA